MIKTTHQLAAELLKCENVPVYVSIDISTCGNDAGRKAFSNGFLGINYKQAPEVILLFDGQLNDNA